MSQRSPIILWLLLAATLSVDAVALHLPQVLVTCSALVAAQLSVICTWSALRVAKTFWSRIAPVLAVFVAGITETVVLGWIYGWELREQMRITLAFYGLHAALLWCVLWLIERTPFWRRQTGVVVRWQISVAQLLIVMTIVAVLAVALRPFDPLGHEMQPNYVLICSSVALAVVSVIAWSVSLHWLLRLAGVLGFALLLGASWSLSPESSAFHLFIVHYLIQGIVLSAWLGLGPILPVSRTDAAGEA